MGTKILPYLIWYLGASGIFVVVLRMIVTRRWLAASVAFVLSLAAHLPFYFIIGWNMFPILDAELALALIIGVPALVHSKRWWLLGVCLAVTLVPATTFMFPVVELEDTALKILIVPLLVWGFGTLSAPVCVALASVFFVGAFIERRPYRTGLCVPS